MARAKHKQDSKSSPSLSELITRAATGDPKAIKAFQAIGDAAVPKLIAAWHGPCPSQTHPRDFLENVTAAIASACHKRADALIEVIRDDALYPDPFLWLAVSALCSSKDSRVNDLLLTLLSHKSSLIRETAADGLIRRKERRAVDPIIELLRKSRSDSMLTFIIISGLRSTPEMQDARAIPIIERVLERRRVSPGTREAGNALLATLRELGKSLNTIERLDWTDQTISPKQLKVGASCPQLKSLILDNVKGLDDAVMRAISEWKSLEELTMEFDWSLRGLDGGPIGKLTSLRRLSFRNCEFAGKPETFLRRLTCLEALSLTGTNCAEKTLSVIGTLAQLRKLHLSSIKSESAFQSLSKLSRLEQLWIDWGCVVTRAGTAELGRLTNLQILSIDCSEIDDEAFRELESLTQLRYLRLPGAKLSLDGLTMLTRMSKLTHLDLDGTLVGDEGLKVLSKCRGLQCLSLRRAGLTSHSAKTFKSMKGLREIIIYDQLKGESRKMLQAARPNLRINESYSLECPY